ncbi:MAG: twin-arginine translocation signal domain-containing protein [Deltaproteobacteria bacterium]|nr:twin-arginine translocation signal domain-containing protein [Deltaproteobacteria bacterium]
MLEKNHKPKRTDNSETSRRTFLKTGAALAGAALLGEAFNAAFVSAAQQNRKDLSDVQLLFVQNAKDVVMKDGRLTLIGVSPTTIFFTDRPNRIAGHMHTEDFVLEWQKGAGPESFHTDPPNATLSVFAEDDIVDVVVELKNPRLAGGALVYDVGVLEQDEPIPSGPVSLFIDPIGRPLSPGSIAGVRRRTRRRAVRRAAVLD